jgi:hypothetical protein
MERSKLLQDLKETFQDCNINFLIGSGLSRPFLDTLGNIEVLLSNLDELDLSGQSERYRFVKASIYRKFFLNVIEKNLSILREEPESKEVLDNYKMFLRCINILLLKRKTTLLNKQVNLFTTNIDIFIEKALEETSIEFNDGFNGRFYPIFNLSNFKKSYFKKSLHYDNTSEIPVFNLLKVHGSLTWRTEENVINFSRLLMVRKIKPALDKIENLIEIDDGNSDVENLIEGIELPDDFTKIDKFLELYETLSIVNPNKEKFKQTILNQTYYELLRIFSNELEKENTALFVLGFSFADEHVKEITLRALNSNPTLKAYIFAYNEDAAAQIKSRIESVMLRNDNIEYIFPEEDEAPFTFNEINDKVFRPLKNSIREN